jgi:Flp pilus assembly secretin CpaC
MNKFVKFAVAAVGTAALTMGPAGSAIADEVPCADQQAQVTKAEDALARVTAVFERQQAKVKKAKKEVVLADTVAEQAKAAKGLKVAQEKKDAAKKAKKAQLMRLQKAQQRLDNCLAAQEPVEEPAP